MELTTGEEQRHTRIEVERESVCVCERQGLTCTPGKVTILIP